MGRLRRSPPKNPASEPFSTWRVSAQSDLPPIHSSERVTALHSQLDVRIWKRELTFKTAVIGLGALSTIMTAVVAFTL